MRRTLLAKAIGDAWLLLAALFVFMFAFPLIFIWASGMVSLGAFSDFVANALPQEWQRVWGVPISDLVKPAGRIALVWVHPLTMLGALAWSISRGSDCVSGEIGRGTMEMLLAQPVRRIDIFATQAIVAVAGSALLAFGAWCGTALGITTSSIYETVSPRLFIPPALNLFGLMVCTGGMTALISSWDNVRWRTIGTMGGFYVISTGLAIASQISEGWRWLRYLSFITAFKPQIMVARPERAWLLLSHRADHTNLGLGGWQLVLFGLGVLCYIAGAIVFSRREIPAAV